jgi:polyferredoxin
VKEREREKERKRKRKREREKEKEKERKRKKDDCVLGSSIHDGACLWCTEFCDTAIEQINLVEEINGCNKEIKIIQSFGSESKFFEGLFIYCSRPAIH